MAWTGQDARELSLTFDRLHKETNPLIIISPELCEERLHELCLPWTQTSLLLLLLLLLLFCCCCYGSEVVCYSGFKLS